MDLDGLAGGEFDPPWLPVPGWPVSVTSDEQLDLRFNEATGTVAVAPDGASAGVAYDVVARDCALRRRSSPPRERLVTSRGVADLTVPQLQSFAADTLEGADVGFEQIEAIRGRLADLGAYDSRAASPSGRPGHSLGRLAEFVNDPDRLAAFEEQYAATGALLARSEGLPARRRRRLRRPTRRTRGANGWRRRRRSGPIGRPGAGRRHQRLGRGPIRRHRLGALRRHAPT